MGRKPAAQSDVPGRGLWPLHWSSHEFLDAAPQLSDSSFPGLSNGGDTWSYHGLWGPPKVLVCIFPRWHTWMSSKMTPVSLSQFVLIRWPIIVPVTCECCAYMCIHTCNWCLWRPEKHIRSPGTSCKSPRGCCKLNLGPQQAQQVFLTAESVLPPPCTVPLIDRW